NLGWKNESFRGFADYMATPEFEEGLRKLNEMLASAKPPIEKGAKPGLPNLKTAVMCAEAVPWRCHRSLISDAETVRGVQVEHLMSPTSILPHEMTSFAKVDKKSNPPKVTYPAQPKDPNQPGLPGMPEASPPKRSKKR
ncbi:MAG TPA: DUF488 domain-containing protein, partial [bacterium]|nr:DUF488 domain-containing protein [bacterium]